MVVKTRGPYARTETRRREIAEATLAIVTERGHKAVTALEVAEKAGLSEPGVLYHFPTKESLLIAALELFDDLEIDPLENGGAYAEAGRQAHDGVRRTNFVRLYSEMSGEAPNPQHPAHDFFRQRWERSNAVLADDLRRLRDAGLVQPDLDLDATARRIHAAWEGLQLQWLVSPKFDIRADLEQVMSSLTGLDPAQAARLLARAQGARISVT